MSHNRLIKIKHEHGPWQLNKYNNQRYKILKTKPNYIIIPDGCKNTADFVYSAYYNTYNYKNWAEWNR